MIVLKNVMKIYGTGEKENCLRGSGVLFFRRKKPCGDSRYYPGQGKYIFK